MKMHATVVLCALAVAAIAPAGAFDVQQYRLVDLTHAYDSQTLYWPSVPPMVISLLDADPASHDAATASFGRSARAANSHRSWRRVKAQSVEYVAAPHCA